MTLIDFLDYLLLLSSGVFVGYSIGQRDKKKISKKDFPSYITTFTGKEYSIDKETSLGLRLKPDAGYTWVVEEDDFDSTKYSMFFSWEQLQEMDIEEPWGSFIDKKVEEESILKELGE